MESCFDEVDKSVVGWRVWSDSCWILVLVGKDRFWISPLLPHAKTVLWLFVLEKVMLVVGRRIFSSVSSLIDPHGHPSAGWVKTL